MLVRWLRAWHVWVPCVLILAIALPNVTFMLPATRDYLEEVYQPLQALKFFKSHGQAFHKYGPMPNFLLAPGYAASIAYWHFTGSFSKPSENYPYGFAHPHQQIGFLILQTRALFVLLGMVCLGGLAIALSRVTRSKWAIFFAFAVCAATNYALVQRFPPAKPDGPMLAFCAAALAVYIRILYDGLTTRRGVLLSLFAVAAVSSKELAAPMFVFPYLALVVIAWRSRASSADDKTRSPLKAIIIAIVVGIVAYALLNIVYAPHTWLKRMQFWSEGPGIDPDVWGTTGGPLARVIGALVSLFDNFGPAGSIIAVIGIVAFFIARPKRWIVLSLPFVSVTALGISRIAYAGDRFYPIVALSLMLPIAAGLGALADWLRKSPGAGKTLVIIGVVLVAINFWFAQLVWIASSGRADYMVERHVQTHLDKSTPLTIFTIYQPIEGASRLEYLGYNFDPRSMSELARDYRAGKPMPEYAYVQDSQLQFFEEARTLPARADMFRNEVQFDINAWPGPEGIGYKLQETLVPSTPTWYPFDWMPAVKIFRGRKELRVYRLTAPTTQPATRP